MKKIIRILLISFCMFFLFSCSLEDFISTDEPEKEKEQEKESDSNTDSKTDNDNQSSHLVIIEANDVHGYIMQDENGRGGISNMAYSINKIRKQYGDDNVLLIANGDMFQGTGLVRMSMGQVMIDIMNEMKFDAACLGNHEFDWDLPVILNYFDGDASNGEANFPLVNSNVKQNGALVTDQNIVETAIFDKAGIKVGFIGLIGDVKSSINALFADKYTFDTSFNYLLTELANHLKGEGADIIVVSIHDGDADEAKNFSFNKICAQLKDSNGNYLIDAVINGHTHTHQATKINRTGGVALPIVQSRPYASNQLYEFGRIDLEIENKKVTNCSTDHISATSSGAFYDKNTQNVLNEYYERDKEFLETPIVYSSNYINRYGDELHSWVSSVMLHVTDADFALCNTGGMRANIAAGDIKFEDIYQLNPFDNYIIMHQVSKSKIETFLEQNEGYYFYDYKDSQSASKETLTVAVVDYVYYSSYYKNCRLENNKCYDTSIILRDALIMDLKARNRFNIYSDYESVLTKQVSNIEYSNLYYVAFDNKKYIYGLV